MLWGNYATQQAGTTMDGFVWEAKVVKTRVIPPITYTSGTHRTITQRHLIDAQFALGQVTVAIHFGGVKEKV